MGASKVLIISARYTHTRLQVDVPSQESTVVRFLQRQGFNADTRILSDTVQAYPPPTRSNIMTSLRWLVGSVVPGDSLFLVFSGRAIGRCLAPSDHDIAGGIDFETFRTTVLPFITAGVKLTILFDLEEGGDVADLPYQLIALGGGGFTSRERPAGSEGDIVVFSTVDSLGYGGCAAVVTAFMSVMNQSGGEASAEDMLVKMRDVVKARTGDEGIGVAMGTTSKTHPNDVYSLGAQQRPLLTNIHPTLLDPRRAEGTTRAVLISVSYNNKLPNAEAALSDIKSLLLRNGYPAANIRTLTDTTPGAPHPTKGNILASLRWLTNSSDPGDHLFLYFTGYGGDPPSTQGVPLPAKTYPGIAPVDWMTQGTITPREVAASLLASAPSGVNITGLFDTVYTAEPVELPYILTCEREGGTSYTNLPVPEHPASAVFISTTPDVKAQAVSPLNGVLTSAFIRTMAGYGKPPSLVQVMYGVNSMLGGMVRDSGHLPRLVSSRRFNETDAFLMVPPKEEPVPQSPISPAHLGVASPVSPVTPATPVRYGGGVAGTPSRGEIDEHMRQIQQSLNDALSLTKTRTNATHSAHRSPPRSPSPPAVGGAGFLQNRTLLLNSLEEPLGMRLNPDPQGMVVASVTAGSAAHRSGLAPGDVIGTIVGYPVRSSNDVRHARLLASRSGMLEVHLTLVPPAAPPYGV